MELIKIDGNLLNSRANLILHQVNCTGAMNSGVAKAIREKWPVVFERYSTFVSNNKNSNMLGTVLPVAVSDTQKIMNLFAQENYGYDGRRYTSYDAIDICLYKVAQYCETNDIKSIALPWHMSCDRGGANWDVIMDMVKQHFDKLDITIEIWKLK